MKPARTKTVAILLAAVFLGCSGIASAQQAPLNLSLKEAIKRAVEKNLDVRAELYNPAMAEADIRRNLGIYDTLLNLQTNYTHATTLPPVTITTGTTLSRDQALQFNAGASQLIRTGGTVGLAFNNSWNSSNVDPTRAIPTYYQSDLTLSFSQPLLKNFGREATELGINVARFAKEGSLDRFKTRLSDTVAQVRNEYFKLYSLREDLEVKKTSLALAQKILSDTKGQVKAGVLPAMEILNAEFGVATREKDIIDAERAVKDETDVIRVLLQLNSENEISPADLPTRQEYPVAEDEALTLALIARPELWSQRANVKTSDLQMRVTRNRTRPDLSLNASAALTGLDEHYNRDIEKIGSGNYPVWVIGLQFSYPLGNSSAENDYIRSRLTLEQARTQLQSLESSIANEVRTAIRSLQSSYKQLEVTDRGRAFAEERLNAFIKKNKVGLATTRDVLDVENDLVAAKNNQIKALADYNNALTQFWRSTGEILDKEGIKVSEKEGDALYGAAAATANAVQ
jgi:outer membrane protein